MKAIRFSEYDLTKPGLYPAVVASVDEDEGQYGPQLKMIFALGGKAEGKTIYGWCSPVLTPKSKLFGWLQALAPGVQIAKGFQLDPADLVGRECRMVLGVKVGSDGVERNTIDSLLPIDGDEEEAGETGSPPPKASGLPPRQPVGAGGRVPF